MGFCQFISEHLFTLLLSRDVRGERQSDNALEKILYKSSIFCWYVFDLVQKNPLN